MKVLIKENEQVRLENWMVKKWVILQNDAKRLGWKIETEMRKQTITDKNGKSWTRGQIEEEGR